MTKTEIMGKIKKRIHNFDDIFPPESTLFDEIVDESIKEYSKYKPYIGTETIIIEEDKEYYSLPVDCKTIFDLYHKDDDSILYPSYREENQDILIIDDLENGLELTLKYFSVQKDDTLQFAESAIKEYTLFQVYDFISDKIAQLPNFKFGDSNSDNYNRYKALSNKAKKHEDRFESMMISQTKDKVSGIVNQSIENDSELRDAIEDDYLGF